MNGWYPWTPRERQWLLSLALVPALVLGTLAMRGGWYADDLDFLIHGRRGFSLDLLLTPVNDHIVPGLRVVYAVLALIDGPSWGFSVLVRTVLWYLAVVLMAALVTRLTGSRWAAALAVLVYGLSSISMPSFMSLSSGVNTIPAQVAGLVLIHATLDWFQTGRRVSLLVVGSALFIAMAFWEKSGLIVLTAAAAVVLAGLVRSPKRALGWLAAVAVGGGSFAVLYLATSSASISAPSPALAGELVLEGVARTMLPALVGGPWEWSLTQPPYFGVAHPPTFVIVGGGLMVAVGLLLSWRHDRRVLAMWAAALLFAVIGTPVVAAGRYESFGELITRHHHYWADAAIPVSLAVVCTAAAVPRRRGLLIAGTATALVWAVGTIVSYAAFAGPWANNPSRHYLDTLSAQIEQARPVALWDSPPPLDVMPYVSDNRRVSNLVELTGTEGATFLATGGQPFIVDGAGEIRGSRMRTWAEVDDPDEGSCNNLLKGVSAIRVPLETTLTPNLWSTRIEYLASPESVVRVEAEDESGRRVTLLGDRTWEAGLSASHLMTPDETSVRALIISTDDVAANVCIGKISVGTIEVLR